MTGHRFPSYSRRAFGAQLLAASAIPSAPLTLSNGRLELTVAGLTRRIRNLETGETVALPAEHFAVELDDHRRMPSSAFALRSAAKTAAGLELLFANETLEARIRYELAPEKAYLRKRIWLRRSSGAPARVKLIELDDWRGVRRPWASTNADKLPYGSHPIHCDTWWAGVEFVAAFNEYSSGGFVLRSRPGLVPIGSDWWAAHPTVAGTAPQGRARAAFLRYIDDVRQTPPRFVTCYNAWWTLPKLVRWQDNVALIEELKAKLHARHGVFFDIVATDMGWSHPQSVWQIDRAVLPNGFDEIIAALNRAGSKMGLWMSPSEWYPPVCDYDWFERQGYTVLRRSPAEPMILQNGVSLADPRYRAETKASLDSLVRKYGLAHIKFDGFQGVEPRAHHDMPAGDDSVEPLAEYSLELLRTAKAANPQLVTEPTYMNSLAAYISPWQLMDADSIWANTSDCALGINPAPEYRDAHINAREWLVFRSLDEVWLPQNAVQYFDIVHVDQPGGFANLAAMAVGRGRFFFPVYLNPKIMGEEDWTVLAGLMKWAGANQDILRNTEVVTSRVEAGEPYVYAHWLGTHGILVIRNPSNVTVDYALDLRKTGAPDGLKDAVCCTQFPYRRGVAANVTARSTVTLHLAPWEVIYLEVTERAQLKEPVVVGGRWYRESAASTAVAPDAGVKELRIFEPGGTQRTLAVETRLVEVPSATLKLQPLKKLPEAEWFNFRQPPRTAFLFHYPAEPGSPEVRALEQAALNEVPPKLMPTCAFEAEATVHIPRLASRGEALLLIEFPGRTFRPTECTATINGKPVTLRTSDSASHVGFWVARPDNAWRDMAQHESQWCWYICDVEPGDTVIRYSGRAGDPAPRFRLWAWAEHDLRKGRVNIPLACSEPALPQHEADTLRQGAVAKA